jgi:hypothetical protein
MQQSTETETSSKWQGVIADLTKRGANFDAEAVNLANEADKLALDAELGINGAGQQLQKLRREQAAKLAAGQNLQTALEAARQRHAKAVRREADAAEVVRRERLSEASKQFMEQAVLVDDGMRDLAARFEALGASLDRLEAIATTAEAQPLQQLRSQFGPTLAAAHFGLGKFIALGRESTHVVHRQPLATFTAPFMSAWLDAGKE